MQPVFGVSLDVAIQRDPSFDDVPLPAFFRHCIDYLEKYGLSSEGIYRVSPYSIRCNVMILSSTVTIMGATFFIEWGW